MNLSSLGAGRKVPPPYVPTYKRTDCKCGYGKINDLSTWEEFLFDWKDGLPPDKWSRCKQCKTIAVSVLEEIPT